jgi:hypothetical protein
MRPSPRIVTPDRPSLPHLMATASARFRSATALDISPCSESSACTIYAMLIFYRPRVTPPGMQIHFGTACSFGRFRRAIAAARWPRRCVISIGRWFRAQPLVSAPGARARLPGCPATGVIRLGLSIRRATRKMKPSSRPRYFYGAIAFIGVVVVVFASLIALQRMLGTISYAP